MQATRNIMSVVLCTMVVLATTVATARVVTIELSHWGGVERLAELEEITARFHQEHPGIQVKVQVPGSTITDRDVILTRMAGGIPPDIVGISSRLMESLLPTSSLLSLSQFIKRDHFDVSRFHPGAFINSTYSGEIYGVPYMNSPFADYSLVYNRDHFNEAGLAYPAIGWTYDDFARTAKKLTFDRSGDGLPDRWGYAGSDPRRWDALLYSNDVEVVGPGSVIMLDRPEAIQAFEFWYHDLPNVYGVVGGDYDTGLASISFHTSLPRGAITKKPAWDWGIAQMPRGPNAAHSISRGGSYGMGIMAASQHPEEAWTFLKWFVSNDIVSWRVNQFDNSITLWSLLRSPAVAYPNHAPWDLMPLFQMEARPVLPWPDMLDLVRKEVTDPVAAGKISVTSAVQASLGAVRAILDRSPYLP